MKAYSIVIKDHEVSELGFWRTCGSSSQCGNTFEINRYDAVTHDKAMSVLLGSGLSWNYPWDKPVRDINSGLLKSPYQTRNPNARIACALSHYKLWEKCYKEDETFLIMEHDCVWFNKLDIWVTEDPRYDIIGINDPRGCTRRSNQFHQAVKKAQGLVTRAPKIDEDYVPQGIAGNSAYIMQPTGAKKMLDLVSEYGLWPNDALMCRQLVPSLGVTKTYYTGVQGLPSTTT